jgi:hypothetical protein
MRTAALGASAIAGFALATIAVAVGPKAGFAQRPAAPSATGGGLTTLATSAGDHHQQITIVDPDTRTMAVYHVDTTSGEIVLKSVRNIHYDLQMIEFNGTSPLPGEIRAILEQR